MLSPAPRPDTEGMVPGYVTVNAPTDPVVWLARVRDFAELGLLQGLVPLIFFDCGFLLKPSPR